MNAKEESVKLLMESYDRGVEDAKQAALVTIAQVVYAEREAIAEMVDHILKPGGGTWGDAIRARGEA